MEKYNKSFAFCLISKLMFATLLAVFSFLLYSAKFRVASFESVNFLCSMNFRNRFSETKHSAYDAKLNCASLLKELTHPSTAFLFADSFGGTKSSTTVSNNSFDFRSFLVIRDVFPGCPSCLSTTRHLSQSTVIVFIISLISYKRD